MWKGTHAPRLLMTRVLVSVPFNNVPTRSVLDHDMQRVQRLHRRRVKVSHFGSDSPAKTTSIGGCLARHWHDWGTLGAEEWVIQVLREGYRIPFHSSPPLSRVPLHLVSYSADSERGKALEAEITALIDKRAVEEAPSTPGFYSRMFVVPKASGVFVRSSTSPSSTNTSSPQSFGWKRSELF